MQMELKAGLMVSKHWAGWPLMIRIRLRAFATGECRRWPTAFVRGDSLRRSQRAAKVECRRLQKVFARGDWRHQRVACPRRVATDDWRRFPRKAARAGWRRPR